MSALHLEPQVMTQLIATFKLLELFFLCFTSCIIMIIIFLSGNPKGAMLTHGNVISNTAAFIRLTEVNTLTQQLDLKDVKFNFFVCFVFG